MQGLVCFFVLTMSLEEADVTDDYLEEEEEEQYDWDINRGVSKLELNEQGKWVLDDTYHLQKLLGKGSTDSQD